MDFQQVLGNNFERAVITAEEDIRSDRNKREYARYRWAGEHMAGKSVLDVGCSSGFGYRVLRDFRPSGFHYRGIDYDANIVQFANSQFGDRFRQADVNSYDFKHHDAIVAFEILEHLENGRELAQKLKEHCDEVFCSVPYNEEPGFWGPHHKLHRLTAQDFPGFEYCYMNSDGEIRNTPWPDPINLMLMYWARDTHKGKRVSVIVTNHNYGEFFDECLDSIVRQTYRNFELITVDDASTDGSEKFGATRADQHIMCLSHRGAVGAKLEGLAHAKGEYICFIDADDAIEPEYLAKCVAALEADPLAAIAYTDFWHCGDKDNGIVFPEFSAVRLEKENFMLGSSLFRRSAYDDTDGLDRSLPGMEDYDLWLAMIRAGWRAVRVPGYLYRYRAHGKNRSNKVDILDCFHRIWRKHRRVQHVTVDISTKDRYDTSLPMAIAAVLTQTRLPDKIVIVDDGEDKDLRDKTPYQQLFHLMEEKGIPWYWVFGQHRGQHVSHETVQDMAEDLVWRLDDDVVPEADCLEKLLADMTPDVGVVGGLILTPPVAPHTSLASNKIEDLRWAPNKQWFHQASQEPEDVDHLHCSFLYRKGIAHYERSLSTVAHTEETLFTYSIRRAGYRVVLEPKAITWHMRNPRGGIRSYGDPGLWAHDEAIFNQRLREWGVQFNQVKFIYLDNGLGDHLVFKQLLPELQRNFSRIIIACCYPEVFEGCEKVEIMSLAEAVYMVGDGLRFSLYKWIQDHDWHGQVVEAFRRIYEL